MNSPTFDSNEAQQANDHLCRRMIFIAFIVFAGACVVTVALGRVTGDEGWYLYLAREVWSGRLPYRDFLFTQTPLILYTYAPIATLAPGSFLAARALSAIFGIGAWLLSILAARRAAGPVAGALVAALLASNAAACFDVSSVKTAALAAFLLALALGLYARAGESLGGRLAAVIVLGLGVLTRLSLAPAFLLLAVLFLRTLARRSRAASLAALALGLAAAGFLAGWFASTPTGERAWFGLVTFHHAYFGAPRNLPSRAAALSFARGVAANEGLALVVGAGALAVWTRDVFRALRAHVAVPISLRLAGLCFGIWLLTTLVHATRTAPYPTYQTAVLPALALAAALALTPHLRTRRRGGAAVVALYLAALATVPWQEWPLRGCADAGSLCRLEEAARIVAREARGRPILAFDSALAVAAGVPLVRGWEMGEFAYFPFHAAPERHGVKNRASLHADLFARPPGVVALRQRDLIWIEGTQGDLPILPRLRDEYREVGRVARYGQFGEDLYVLAPRI